MLNIQKDSLCTPLTMYVDWRSSLSCSSLAKVAGSSRCDVAAAAATAAASVLLLKVWFVGLLLERLGLKERFLALVVAAWLKVEKQTNGCQFADENATYFNTGYRFSESPKRPICLIGSICLRCQQDGDEGHHTTRGGKDAKFDSLLWSCLLAAANSKCLTSDSDGVVMLVIVRRQTKIFCPLKQLWYPF